MEMRTTLFLLCLHPVWGLRDQRSSEPLPEGNNGIAARYPGDAGIGSDPAVIFADDFESYGSAAGLASRWNEVFHSANIRIASEPGNFFNGSRALEFTVPKQSGEVSNEAIKYVSPGARRTLSPLLRKVRCGVQRPGIEPQRKYHLGALLLPRPAGRRIQQILCEL